MKKGIVMDVNKHFITLLTREGEFLKTKKLQETYVIGSEIDIPQVELTKHKWSHFQLNKWRLVIASSLAIFLVFLSFFPYYLDNKVYAYMSIDVNPSLELGVNHDLKVISIKALNDDGKKIAGQVNDWKKKKIEDVTKSIISECKQEGFLDKGQTVIIATVMNKKSQTTKENLQKKMAKLSTNYQEKNIHIETIAAQKEDRNKAIKQGISTGRLLEVENKVNHNNKKNQSHPDSSQQIIEKKAVQTNEKKENIKEIPNKEKNNGKKTKDIEQRKTMTNNYQKWNQNNRNHQQQKNTVNKKDQSWKELPKQKKDESKSIFKRHNQFYHNGTNDNKKAEYHFKNKNHSFSPGYYEHSYR